MLKRLRGILFAVFTTLLLVLPGSIFAQQQPVYCLDLNEEDCALYESLAVEPNLPDSTAFELGIDGTVTGMMPEPTAFAATVSGAYVTDTAALDAAVAAFEDTPVLEVSFNDILGVVRGALGSFDAELNIALSLPPELGGDAFGPFDLWLVDGVGYVDLTPLGMLAGDPSLEGVYGINMIDLVQFPLQNVTVGDITSALDEAGEAFMTGFDAGMEQTNPFNQMITVMPEEEIAQFVTLQRLADETVNGTNVVVFQTDVAVDAVFGVEVIREQVLANIGEADLPEGVTEDDLLNALEEALAGSTVTVVERYDTETGYLLSATFDMAINLDFAPLAALDGTDPAEAGMPESFGMDLTFEFTRSDVNAVDAITLPEGAEELPVEALFGEMMGQ